MSFEFITVLDKLLFGPLLYPILLKGVGWSQSFPLRDDSLEVNGVLDDVIGVLAILLMEVESLSGASHSSESSPMPLLFGP